MVPEFNGRQRMTLTPPVVNAARARIVLATGAAKRPVIRRWLDGDRSLPVAVVRRAGTAVFLDPAAAPGD
jgi:6-phosphogluconolactonase/glucosamine-6-phosphate isomerase/deaminase